MSLSFADRLALERYHGIVMYKKMKAWGRDSRIAARHLKRKDEDGVAILQAVFRAYSRMIQDKNGA